MSKVKFIRVNNLANALKRITIRIKVLLDCEIKNILEKSRNIKGLCKDTIKAGKEKKRREKTV